MTTEFGGVAAMRIRVGRGFLDIRVTDSPSVRVAGAQAEQFGDLVDVAASRSSVLVHAPHGTRLEVHVDRGVARIAGFTKARITLGRGMVELKPAAPADEERYVVQIDRGVLLVTLPEGRSPGSLPLEATVDRGTVRYRTAA